MSKKGKLDKKRGKLDDKKSDFNCPLYHMKVHGKKCLCMYTGVLYIGCVFFGEPHPEVQGVKK